MLVLRDDAAALSAALRQIIADGPRLVVISGGLGTTHDDVTSESLAAALGRTLEEDGAALRFVEQRTAELCRRRGLSYDDILVQTRRQALLPAQSTVVAPAGAAPGYTLTSAGSIIVVLPGVPSELESMWPVAFSQVASGVEIPLLQRRLVRIYGVGELQTSAVVAAVPRDDVEVSITASAGEVTIAMVAALADPGASESLEQLEADLCQRLPVFSTDGRTVDQIVAGLLQDRDETVAVGESCTGGLLSARLTDLSGSSAYFVGGAITYSNDAKTRLLDVPADVLGRHGAVSAETAVAMAEGARDRTGATYGLATTGIAGPGGATLGKPVGLVYIACAGPRATGSRRCDLFGDRDGVRTAAVVAALHLLRVVLHGGTPDPEPEPRA